MVIGVQVEAEDLLTGDVRHTTSCLLTFVAIDEDFRPAVVPGLERETREEESLWEATQQRREQDRS
jgi:acyl-CoA hydrolase